MTKAAHSLLHPSDVEALDLSYAISEYLLHLIRMLAHVAFCLNNGILILSNPGPMHLAARSLRNLLRPELVQL